MACRADGWTVEISQSESGRGLIGKEKERESGCGVHSSEPVGDLFGKMDTTVDLLMSQHFLSMGCGFLRSNSLLLCVGEHAFFSSIFGNKSCRLLKITPVNAALTVAGAYLKIRAPVGPQCHVFCFCKVSDGGSVTLFQVSYNI